MKFITVRELKQKTSEIWRLVRNGEEMIITSNGRPIALLSKVSEDSFEEDLDIHRRAKALKTLDKVNRESLHKGTDQISDREIENEIKAARKRLKRRST